MADTRFASSGRKYQIEMLWETHREILRLKLLRFTHRDIANVLGIAEATVSYTVNSAVGKRHLEVMRGAADADTLDMAKEIRDRLPKALEILDEVMNDPNAPKALRAREANNIIDRAIGKPPQTVKAEHLHAHLTAEDIEDLKKRGRARGIVASEGEDVVDAEVVPLIAEAS
jgi:hypothetical protein